MEFLDFSARLDFLIGELKKCESVFPSKLEVALARSSQTGRGSGEGLPFRAAAWLDDGRPVSWEGWQQAARSLLSECGGTVSRDPLVWSGLHRRAVFDSTGEDFLYFLESWSDHAALVCGFAEYGGPVCLKCFNATSKRYTATGWNGVYYCADCRAQWRRQDYEREAARLLRSSDYSLPIAQAARLFNITPGRLRQWVARGKLSKHPLTRGSGLGVRPSDIARILEKQSAAV